MPKKAELTEDTLSPQAEEPPMPMAFQTPKEAMQDDTIKALQRQIAQLATDLAKISKKTKTTIGSTDRDSSGLGFIRSWEGVPVVGWKMLPGSYVALNQFGQEVDEQYMEITLANGEVKKEHYTKFDQITKINQIPCKILNYCEQNNLGEWRAKKHGLYDMLKVVLSDDNGLTYDGAEIEIPYYAIN